MASLLPVFAGGASAQARGSVEGLVRDETGFGPIEGAIVSLVENGEQVETDDAGRFAFTDLPLGPVTLRIGKPGYGSVVERLEVRRANRDRYEILLPRMETMLRELLVQGDRRKNLGYQEYEVKRSDRYETAADLVANEVPGLSMTTSTGNVGQGSGIRIRGVSTIQGTSAPIIYLDGIRIDTSGPRAGPGTGTGLNVLQTIPASQVERIRVLSGPAATSRFQDGANGVILIETVRGGSSSEDDS